MPQIVLADELEVETDDQDALVEFLEKKVDDACRRAQRGVLPSETPILPLVRLRVRVLHCPPPPPPPPEKNVCVMKLQP